MNQFVFERKRPVVETRQGKLRGVTYGGVNIFMGVKYAHAKRFHMPEEVEPWEGIRDAYKHGPSAMHAMEVNPFSYYRGIHVLEKQSEDCQNLNIWAPKTENGEKKPVFVWIHGGGFFAGNAFEEISFDGFNTAHYADILFVSINHRLNIAGFLNLEEYGEEFKNSANAGIWDLVAALKWIHENIAAFGGDPEKVTICGHSGGGGKVQCLMQIEEAAPYFRAGICLSGAMGGTGFTNPEKSRKTAKAMLDELGITKENIDKIYEVPYQDLVAASRKAGNAFGFAPVPNEFFPGFPSEVGLMPFSVDKPFIYGTVLGEFSMCKLTADEKELMNEEDRVAWLRNSLGEPADRIMELFRKAYPDHDILDLAYLDSMARIPTVDSAFAHVKAGSKNTYLFLAAYTVPEDGQIPIWHGGEVGFIFMNEDKVLALNDPDFGQKYARTLSTMVHNFVKYGDPNNVHLPEWKPVREGENWTMIIDKECRCVVHHDDELMETYDPVAPRFSLPS